MADDFPLIVAVDDVIQHDVVQLSAFQSPQDFNRFVKVAVGIGEVCQARDSFFQSAVEHGGVKLRSAFCEDNFAHLADRGIECFSVHDLHCQRDGVKTGKFLVLQSIESKLLFSEKVSATHSKHKRTVLNVQSCHTVCHFVASQAKIFQGDNFSMPITSREKAAWIWQVVV